MFCILANILFSQNFNFCQSSGCGFYCGFNLYSPDFLWVWAPFHMLCYLCCLLRSKYSSFYLWGAERLVFFILIYRNLKYILDPHLLSFMCIAGIFSWFMAYHFILCVTGSKVINLVYYNLSIFSFMVYDINV